MKGSVKFYNVSKRFGFIAGDDGTEYFVHQSGLNAGVRLHEGDSVTFDTEEGERGPKAVNVSKGDSEEAPKSQDSEDSEEVYEESDEESDEELEEEEESEDFDDDSDDEESDDDNDY